MIITPGSGGEPPGRKLNLWIRYWPESGQFAVQIYDGGSLMPVCYSGMKTRDVATPVGGSRDELLKITKKIVDAVSWGIEHDPAKTGILPIPPSLMPKV